MGEERISGETFNARQWTAEYEGEVRSWMHDDRCSMNAFGVRGMMAEFDRIRTEITAERTAREAAERERDTYKAAIFSAYGDNASSPCESREYGGCESDESPMCEDYLKDFVAFVENAVENAEAAEARADDLQRQLSEANETIKRLKTQWHGERDLADFSVDAANTAELQLAEANQRIAEQQAYIEWLREKHRHIAGLRIDPCQTHSDLQAGLATGTNVCCDVSDEALAATPNSATPIIDQRIAELEAARSLDAMGMAEYAQKCSEQQAEIIRLREAGIVLMRYLRTCDCHTMPPGHQGCYYCQNSEAIHAACTEFKNLADTATTPQPTQNERLFESFKSTLETISRYTDWMTMVHPDGMSLRKAIVSPADLASMALRGALIPPTIKEAQAEFDAATPQPTQEERKALALDQGRMLCSVCKKDIRTCPHVPSRQYDGVTCVVVEQPAQEVAR